jgi:hypothetical protein
VNREDQKRDDGWPFWIIEVPEGTLPPNTMIVGDFTEFERARQERREVNPNAFMLIRDVDLPGSSSE